MRGGDERRPDQSKRAEQRPIAGPAARYGAVLASGFAAFRAAAAQAGGDTCAAGLRVKLASGGCDLHPSARGAQVLAAAITEAIAVPSRR